MSRKPQISNAQKERIRALRVTDPMVADALAGFLHGALQSHYALDVPSSEIAGWLDQFGVAVQLILDPAVDEFNEGFRAP